MSVQPVTHNPSKPAIRRAAGIVAMLALGYGSWLMLKIVLEYIPVRDDAAFLAIKQQFIHIAHWRIAFFVHVFSSMFALIAGFTQFWRGILRKVPAIHRAMGRLYVLDVLFVTGPASFIMALYANGGMTSRISFTVLSLLWIGTTALAWREVMRRNFAAHREWMIRSYALTLSALALRGWKMGLVALFHPHPMDVYRIVAWLGWVPNLLLAEYLIRRKKKAPSKSATPAPAAIPELSAR